MMRDIVVVLVFCVLLLPLVSAEVVWQSEWNTTAGTSQNALGDGGVWNDIIGLNANRLIQGEYMGQVQSSAGLDFPNGLENVFRGMLYEDGQGVGITVRREGSYAPYSVPAIGEYMFTRVYVRLEANEGDNVGVLHWLHWGGGGADLWAVFNPIENNGQFGVYNGETSFSFILNPNQADDSWGSIALPINTTYRMEVRLYRDTATTARFAVRVYDSTGVLVADETTIVDSQGTPISESVITYTNADDFFRQWQIGPNDSIEEGSMASPGYLYVSGFAVGISDQATDYIGSYGGSSQNPAPEFFFATNWSTALGSTDNAISDGGAYNEFLCAQRADSLTVIEGDSVGWTITPHVLAVQQLGPTECGMVERTDIVPESTDFYGRMYFRDDETQGPSNHPFNLNAHAPIQMVLWGRGISSTSAAIKFAASYDTSGNYNALNTWNVRNPADLTSSGSHLNKGEWYRYEWHVDFLTPTTYRFYPRIYDMSGILVADYTNYVHNDYASRNPRYTLQEWYDASPSHVFTMTDPELARDFGIGQEGPFGDPASGEYWYIADVALSTQGWIGGEQQSTPQDTTPPTITLTAPTSGVVLSAGTTSTTLAVSTNEVATCRYSSSNVMYDSMSNALSGGGSTSHSTTLSGLSDGSSYTYYVRCQDSEGNANTQSTQVMFSVTSPGSSANPTVSVSSSYTGYSSSVIDDEIIDASGGATTTWASSESLVDSHWIEFDFGETVSIDSFTVYWANFNGYLTSQELQVQAWNGNSWDVVGSHTSTTDEAASIIDASGSASRWRLLQPAGMGHTSYQSVLWVTEIDYALSGTVLISSNWSTALGTSVEATGDGGVWDRFYCGRSYIQEVVEGAPYGWDATPNILQMTMDGEGCGLIQNSYSIPEGVDYYLRNYIMVLDANQSTTNHPYKTGWRGSNSIILWSLQQRDPVAQTYRPAVRMGPYDGTSGWVDSNIDQLYAINFLGPELSYGEWYRFETKIEYVGDSSLARSRALPRIYDMDGNLIADEHDYVHTQGGSPFTETTLAQSLAGGAYYQHREADGYLLGHIHWPAMGFEGPGGNSPSDERYFFAGFEARSDTWPGPIGGSQAYLDGDLNRDGIVNVDDLLIIVGNFRRSNFDARADVNNDGVVNVFDLVLVARHFGVAQSSSPSVDGVCGSRATTYSSSTNSWPVGSSYCSSGTESSSPAFPAQGSTVNWDCMGSNGGSTASCSASRQSSPSSSGTLDFSALESYADEFAFVERIDYQSAADLSLPGWGQFEGDLNGGGEGNPGSPPVAFLSEITPTGDDSFARFNYVGLEDGWTGRYHWRPINSQRLAFGVILRANFPSNTLDGRSWKKGVGFRSTTSNTGWAGMTPPGPAVWTGSRTEEQRTQVDVYQITLPEASLYPNTNLDLVSPVEHGEWYSYEQLIDLSTGEVKAWWNGVLYINTTYSGGGTFDSFKLPMITLGGGSGMGPLTDNDYIDVDAVYVMYD